MKASVFLFFFFSFFLQAQEPALDLNAQNLTLQAIKSSPAEIVKAFIIKKTKSEYTKEYFKTVKNNTGAEELFEKVQRVLEKEWQGISKQQIYKFSKEIKYTLKKGQTATIQINNLFSGATYITLFREYNSFEGLPDYYNLLLANLDILSSIKIDENKWTEVQQQKSTWAEVTLIVSNYQNQQSFQTVIKRIDLYKDKEKTQLLSTVIEDRSYNAIVSDWLLSDGFTTKLVGIHAFSVLGYRLQDRINEAILLSNTCEKSTKINSHQVLMCVRPYTQNSKTIAIFIGGILAQVDLVINNNLAAKEKQTIIRHLSNGLKTNRKHINEVQSTWEEYSVDFSYYPNAFKALKITDVNESNKYKLVFSMASQATNKLFEVNQ